MPGPEYQLIHPLNPVTEMMPPEEFTDRDEILAYLEEWFKNIAYRRSRSKALISPRRMGKTAVLDRFVNVMFWRDYNVVPFYIKMKREETTLRQFTHMYFKAFCQQFIAYLRKDPSLIQPKQEDEALLELETDDSRLKIVLEHWREYLKGRRSLDARSMWEAVIEEPEAIAAETGVHCAVIIDEFQEMKSYVYDTEDIKEVVRGKHMPIDLTATYAWMSQSTYAPMLVSGSAVTMTFETVMGGPLGGRFTVKKLGPMSIADGASLAKQILQGRGIEITDELALYLSELVGGHPYYVYCVANCEGVEEYNTPEDIERAVAWELEQGVIHGFWSTHFHHYEQVINEDADPGLGKRIIYYLLKYQGREVAAEEIAAGLGTPVETVTRKLQKLTEADLVERIGIERYQGLADKMLARYIYQEFGRFVTDVDRQRVAPPGKEAHYRGHYLELLVESIMHKFRGQEAPGRLFGREGETVILPRFGGGIFDSLSKGEGEPGHQLDLLGLYTANRRKCAWVVECRHRRQPLDLEKVAAVEAAAASVQNERRLNGEVQLWFISTGGFTQETLAYLEARGYLYTGRVEINELNRFLGGKVGLGEPEEE